MISDTHAVIDPGTVMVVSFHAYIANGAVSGSWRADHLTVWAQISGTELLKKFQKWQILFRPKNSWVS